MKVIAGSWLMASVLRLLMMHRSSATVWTCGNRSLIHRPLFPQSFPPAIGGTTRNWVCSEVIPVTRCVPLIEGGNSLPAKSTIAFF